MNGLRRAATLAELVGVVTAVAALMALLAPALGEVRRHGKDTRCLQNLAGIAQASVLYASTDPGEQAVPLHPIAGYAGPHHVPSHTVQNVLALCYGGKSGRGPYHSNTRWWGTAFGRGPADRPLNSVLYKRGLPNYSAEPYGSYAGSDILDRWRADETLDLSIYRCPSDSGHAGGPALHDFKYSRLRAYDHYGTSYHASTMWVGYGPGAPLWSNTPLWHRLTDIADPSETLYYQEICSRYAHWCIPQPANSDDQGYEGVVKGWHGKAWAFNVAFVDGSSDQVRMRGRQNPFLAHYPWATDPIGGYLMWQKVIARGAGWQVDTLPVPPVPTEMIWGDIGAVAPADVDVTGPLRVLPQDTLPDTSA